MQLIDFSYRVQIDPAQYVRAREATFQAIRQAVSEVPGVEAVSTRRQSTFDVRVQRPSAETGKAISTELAAAIAGVDGVQNVKEVYWGRVIPSPAYVAAMAASHATPAPEEAAAATLAARMTDTKARQAAAYLELAELAEREAADWRALAGEPAPVPAPEPAPVPDLGPEPKPVRTKLTTPERVARLQSVEALTEPGEWVLYSDLGLAALGDQGYKDAGAGIVAGRAMAQHNGWTAPWRVLRKAGKDRYEVSDRWTWRVGDEVRDAAWAQAKLESEGVVFVNGVTDGTRRVSLSTLAYRYGKRHGA
jgi:hypothetical protein